MNYSFKTLLAAALVASIGLATGPASAQTEAEVDCRVAIHKNIAKYQAGLAKEIAGCHKSRNGRKIDRSTQCNDAEGSNIKGKRAGQRTKTRDAIIEACTGVTGVIGLYTRCPSPADATDGVDGIDNATELADCLIGISDHYIEFLADAIMGDPILTNSIVESETVLNKIDKEGGKCHGAVGKAFAKAVKTITGSFNKCQIAEDEALSGLPLGDCADFAAINGDGKAGATITAFSDLGQSDGACFATGLLTKLDLDNLHICAAEPAKFTECSTEILRDGLMGINAATVELPGVCPTSADVIINAAHGEKGGASRLDSGWKGLAHHVDVIDQSIGAVTLTGCNADCENCTVSHNSRNGNCRCENDPSVECDSIETVDVANCGAGSKCLGGNNDGDPCTVDGDCPLGSCGTNTCHCMFGPPLAISAANNPVCVINRFMSAFTGGTGEVGSYDVGTATRALVYSGLDASRPCPTCESGTCDGGAQNGKPCTVDATHPDFGPVSFDCMPEEGANISASGLRLNLNFSSGTQSITAAITDGAACAGGNCHCSLCSLDSKVGCTNNADCALFSAGTCNNDPTPAEKPEQNDCNVGYSECVDDGTGTGSGHCQEGPFDKYCSDFIAGNGRGIITCDTNTDCNESDCDGNGIPGDPVNECGTCNHLERRLCSLPTVSATGTPGIYDSQGISVFCSGTTGNTTIDNSGGLPGPGRVKLDFNFDLTCPDGVTTFIAPGGSNCPP